jgi:hypothetical protein
VIKKHKIIEIPQENIFKNDKLNRKQTIVNLSEFIIDSNDSLTLAINAKWGDGKTTFVKLWQEYLNKKEIKSIYFNAWQYDYSNEPLIVLLGELNQYILDNYHDDNVVEKLDKVKEFGVKIIKKALPAFAKGATAGVLEIDKGFESAIGALSEESVKTLIDEYSKEKDIINQFQESIKLLLEEIGDNKPFVVFIDELDRCKPLFAINLLERIKHLFDMDGLIFIFSIDKTQLIESIKSQYGNIDGENYLKRFFDIDYSLPKPNKDNFCEYLNEFYQWEKLLENKEIGNFTHQLNYLEIIKYLSKSLNLSLREIEKVYTYTDIIYKTLNERTYEIILRICMFFVAIKLKDENLYLDLINKRKESEYFFKILFDENIKTQSGEVPKVVTLLKAFVYVIVLNEKELDELIENLERELSQVRGKSNGRYSLEIRNIERLINLVRTYFFEWNELIPFAIKKIEFLEEFKI